MKRPSIYVKMKVLAAIDIAEGKTRDQRIKNVAAMTFTDEQGLPHFHGKSPNKTAIYRFCVEKGLLNANQIARNTFSRMVNKYELLNKDPVENKRRLAFSMQYANQLWQADTMFGPYIGSKQAKLIAFIDDASRVLCHGEFFFEENVDSMVRAIRSAFYKRGLPEQLLVDNGSIYCSQEITLICARVGCLLRHTAVRDAAAKGKIERFFRRVRDQFLIRKLELTSLEKLNQQFTHWVEQDYNGTVHSVLGIKPIDRFGVDLSRIRFLSPSEDTDELFYAQSQRKVKKDNTFSFQGKRYETPVDLRNQKITLRHQRHQDGAVIVYQGDRRVGKARLLDAVANGMMRRKERPQQ